MVSLLIHDLEVRYGLARAVNNVSLRLDPGEIVGLIGRNGVGKSTTMKAVIGLVRAHSGRIEMDGKNITNQTPHKLVRRGLGYVPEERRVFAPITVLENLEVARRAPAWDGATAWTFDDIYQLFPILKARASQVAGTLSGGEQQMLTLARALMANPRYLLVDEPTEGLAPQLVERVKDMLQEVHRRGTAVLLVEQALPVVLSLASRVYVMSKGEITYDGDKSALEGDSEIRRKYLEL